MTTSAPRRAVARGLKAAATGLRGGLTPGWCPACERPTVFVSEGPWHRDQLLCRRCRSIPRWRAVMLALNEVRPNWRDLAVLECAPGSTVSDRLTVECPGYVPTHYWPDVTPGESRHGLRCEDLAHLTFPDGTFDVVVTQDVFEHVLQPDAAFAEVARVLRPGGVHVFTVPLYARPDTVVRARVRDGEIEHLLPEDFHYDPATDSGSLVAREWGTDIVAFIEAVSGLPTSVRKRRSVRLGLRGEFLEVFVTYA